LISFPNEVLLNILRYMDMPSLLSWRSTCSRLRRQCARELEVSRDAIVRAFFHDVDAFWECLTFHRALIIGEAALAFLLRDTAAIASDLHLAVGLYEGAGLQEQMEREFGCIEVTTAPVGSLALGQFATRRFSTPCKAFVTIITSPTSSALAPITDSANTAFMNYLTAHSFACAYPLLTLRRQAIVPSLTTASLALPLDDDTFRSIALQDKCGFVYATHAVPLVPSQFLVNVPNPEETSPHGYLADYYVCPLQARFFGDAGSLVNFFDV
ncbi:hypothetical protein C8Q76DRAFT_566229, partial [Earliella scabrosa]